MQDFSVPKLYLSGYIKGFDKHIRAHSLTRRFYKKGELLTVHGEINNTAHYIHSGIFHLSLTHSSGNLKSMNFFGPETIFPLGVVPHENLIDYEMVIRAFTDVEVYSFPYPVLRQICVEDGETAAMILEQNCDFIGYLFYQDMNHAYAPTCIRVCDILYLYLESIKPLHDVISISQEELAHLVGVSRPQLERVLKGLREQHMIATTRCSIQVIDRPLLRASCSADLLNCTP